jgi:hypothetical protein
MPALTAQSVPIPSPVTRIALATPLPASLDDRWAAWKASERQRDEEAQHEIRTALLLMVVAIALGGAVYLSFGGPQ